MRKRNFLNFAILIFFVVFCSSSISVQAGKVIPGIIDGGEYGVLIKCAFPNTIKLDGKLNDQAWQYAPWHFISSQDASVPAPNDRNASLKFAVCADNEYLYVGFEITDDKVIYGEDTGCNVWKDDSVEVYIDGGNEKAGAYDVNDAQITIGADFIDQEPNEATAAKLLGGCVGTTQGPTTGTIATGKKTTNGWDLEVAIPLKNKGWNIKVSNGSKIGFNVQYNDDDSGGDRDYKLIWCAAEIKAGEGSWSNPSLFAELMFVEALLAVNTQAKIASTWAFIKN